MAEKVYLVLSDWEGDSPITHGVFRKKEDAVAEQIRIIKQFSGPEFNKTPFDPDPTSDDEDRFNDYWDFDVVIEEEELK